MFRRIAMLILAVTILLSFAGCSFENKLHNQTKQFYDIVYDTIPQDMCLKIYYINEYSLHSPRHNLQILMNLPDLTIIDVSYEDLVKHQEHLKKFDPALFNPIQDEKIMDIALYCVFELENSGPILEYAYSDMKGYDSINGIPIQSNSEFLNLISPFLPEDCIYKARINVTI